MEVRWSRSPPSNQRTEGVPRTPPVYPQGKGCTQGCERCQQGGRVRLWISSEEPGSAAYMRCTRCSTPKDHVDRNRDFLTWSNLKSVDLQDAGCCWEFWVSTEIVTLSGLLTVFVTFSSRHSFWASIKPWQQVQRGPQQQPCILPKWTHGPHLKRFC